MSTPVGQSRLQPLQDTQRSGASLTSLPARPSDPKCPDNASRNVLARPRVRCCSSRVMRKLGHMVPASNFRQWPLLLHISTALISPDVGSPALPGAPCSPVNGSRSTSQPDQSSAVVIGMPLYPLLNRK